MTSSSLSLQLANLNDSKVSSKRGNTTEAIGRGNNYSVQHGHSLVNSVLRSVKSKPSVLFKEGKVAADVPLATLRDNSIRALEELKRITGDDYFCSHDFVQNIFGLDSLTFERGLLSEDQNKKVDEKIIPLIHLLTTTFTGHGSTCTSYALHVLEYLIRKYEITSREKTAEALLICVWPHHEFPFFNRVIQLIDLAEISGQAWTFLRPFASKGSSVPSRSIFAKRCARDDGMVQKCMQMAERTAQIANRQNRDLRTQPQRHSRRGISHIFSFVGATISEALSIQCNEISTVKESTLRLVLPYLLSACGIDAPIKHFHATPIIQNHEFQFLCPEYSMMGYFLVSSLNRFSTLSNPVKEVISNHIVSGLLYFECTASNENYKNLYTLERASNGLMVIIDILGANPPTKDFAKAQLKKLGNRKKSDGTDCLIKFYMEHGCPLPKSTYEYLANSKILPLALSNLWNTLDVDIIPLLSSIVVSSIIRLDPQFGLYPLSEKAYGLHVLEKMLMEPSLFCSEKKKDKSEAMFKKVMSNMTSTIFKFYLKHGFVVCSKFDEETSQNKIFTENCQIVLQLIRKNCSISFDKGMSSAVEKLFKRKKKGKYDLKKIATLLSFDKALERASISLMKDDDAVEEKALDKTGLLIAMTDFISPLVALEDDDSLIRLNAIKRLANTCNLNEEVNKQNNNESDRKLLKLVCSDPDIEVSLAAAEALVTILKRKRDSYDVITTDLVLAAMFRWNFVHPKELSEAVGIGVCNAPKHMKLVCATMDICCRVIQSLQKNAKKGGLLQLKDNLVIGIISHLDGGLHTALIDDDLLLVIKTHAAKSIFYAVGQSFEEKDDFLIEKAQLLLITNDFYIKLLKRTVIATNSSTKTAIDIKNAIRVRFAHVFLRSFYKHRLATERDFSTLKIDVIKASLYILRSSIDDCSRNPKDSYDIVLQCFKHFFDVKEDFSCEETNDVVLNLIADITSIRSNIMFDSVCVPIVHYLVSCVRQVSSVRVLMELSLRLQTKSYDVTVLRLLSIVTSIVKNIAATPFDKMDAVIPTLCLLKHDDKKIREKSSNLLIIISSELIAKHRSEEDLVAVAELCKFVGNDKFLSSTSRTMIDENVFDYVLSEAVKASTSSIRLCNALVRQCFLYATAQYQRVGKKDDQNIEKTFNWLPLGNAIGGLYAATTILTVIDCIDDSIYPLEDKWEVVKQLFEAFYSSKSYLSSNDLKQRINTPTKSFIVCLIKLLKGPVRCDEAFQSGVHKAELFRKDYPSSMEAWILTCLQNENLGCAFHEYFRMQVIELVLLSSWTDIIFPKLNITTKRGIAKALLSLRTKGMETAGNALMKLPLEASDYLQFLQDVKSSYESSKSDTNNLIALTFLSECVGEKSKLLLSNRNECWKITALVLDFLAQFTTVEKSEDLTNLMSYDYVCLSLMQTLTFLYDGLIMNKKDTENDEIMQDFNFVVALAGCENQGFLPDGKVVVPLLSDQARSASLDLLSRLCTLAPSAVVQSLIPGMIRIIPTSSNIERQERTTPKLIKVILDAFCSHDASSHVSFMNLLISFIKSCYFDAGFTYDQKVKMFGFMSEALSRFHLEGGVGSFMSSLIAHLSYERFVNITDFSQENKENDESAYVSNEIEIAQTIIGKIDNSKLINTLLQMTKYVSSIVGIFPSTGPFLLKCRTEENTLKNNILYVSYQQIVHICTFGCREGHNLESQQERSIMWFVLNMLSIVKKVMSGFIFKSCTSNMTKNCGETCLYLWQELIQIEQRLLHLKCNSSRYKTTFLEALRIAVEESLDCLYLSLPVPLFVESARGILKQSRDNSLRKRVLLFLCNRSSQVNDSFEAEVFFGSMPEITSVLNECTTIMSEMKDGTFEEKQIIILQQTALVAIEKVAQTIFHSANNDFEINKHFKSIFTPALECVLVLLTSSSKKLLTSTELNGEKETKFNSSQGNLLASATLCMGAFVSILKQRSISHLQRFIPQLLLVMAQLNSFQNDHVNVEGDNDQSTQVLIQTAILSTFQSILKSSPSILPSYAENIFSPSCLISGSLRQTLSVQVDELCSALALEIPFRSLIPILNATLMKSCGKNLNDGYSSEEVRSLLSTMSVSIKHTSSKALVPFADMVVDSLLVICNCDIIGEFQSKLLCETNECLLTLVMKLSEAQLRLLYAKLRDWRGELNDDEEANHKQDLRRIVFWSLSACLSKQLRGIFLPCLSSVTSDLIIELERASMKLCEKPKGSKRRRTNNRICENNTPSDVFHLRPLQHILLCLEHALRSDAYEGGDWIRAEDGERFNQLLDPLAKLMKAKIPSNFPVETDFGCGKKESEKTSGYQKLIEGKLTQERGSVGAVLSQMAFAVGNEQLWKPLNHAIVEACGDEDRVEVRRIGVCCLLKILQTIGEEYMVLLPECLPVLSELLEDTDEEIASYAKECISIGEDLLGESLEDSLK